MADFIIKPASGDTLKLQDEGGDDAISVSTTGVSTISNISSASAFPTGHVIQTLSVSTSTQRTSTSTNVDYESPDITLNITTTGSNKVFINLCAGLMIEKTANENASTRTAGAWGLMRGTTHLMEQDICLRVGGESATTDYNFKMVDSASILYLDSPGAGTHTYKLIMGGVPSNKWTITQCGRVYASSSYPQCSMILQEIAQ